VVYVCEVTYMSQGSMARVVSPHSGSTLSIMAGETQTRYVQYFSSCFCNALPTSVKRGNILYGMFE
jgi:hypothetical protein